MLKILMRTCFDLLGSNCQKSCPESTVCIFVLQQYIENWTYKLERNY